MESTIISIDIATLFIDIQINLAISHLINLPDKKRVIFFILRSVRLKSQHAHAR
jgi:hypothetical protein